ncbi:ABC transporter ATP-binding protein [Cytobacillus gottheilii]|uniref:ABC transporter ATP-binding protein n=1 Tax=Cytobacillus gottheilii TaxID=859144 RepID=UPI0009BB5A6D|nr:ABC transporter ATP-binding protein [Cytobacillus gottheilii]
MTVLSLTNLSKRFGSNHVLDKLELHIKKSEFVSILGPSGSGKSTLFHMIGGLLTPDEGTIALNEEKINGITGKISYMPQSPSLLPWRSILDNTLLGQELQGKTDESRAKEMLKVAGLGEYLNAYPHELSGGMKQRAAFIRALLSPQELMLLDEPFSALDELTRSDMQQWLLQIWEELKPTILFVTHNIEEAILLSDRIVILSHRPAKIREGVTVPFSRPRDEQLPLSEEFIHFRQKLHKLIQEENRQT